MPIQSRRPPGAELAYPASYRARECSAIINAIRSRASLMVCGIGGGGKSHLLRFLAFHPAVEAQIRLPVVRLYLDCNAVIENTVAGVFRGLLLETGTDAPVPSDAADALAALRLTLAAHMDGNTGCVVLLDRFERIGETLQPAVLDGLRHLRDYLGRRVSYVLSCRAPLPLAVLSEEFEDLLHEPPVVWVGPLAPADARWNVAAIVSERGEATDETTQDALLDLSGGHPRLLRAATLVWLDTHASDGDLRNQFAGQAQVRRVCESIWRELDAASQDIARQLAYGEAMSLSADHPLLLTGLALNDTWEQTRLASPLVAHYIRTLEVAPPLELTALESKLWQLLREQPGTLARRDQLIEALYGDNPDGVNDEALTALAARLRRKLVRAGLGTLEAMRGQGYRFLPAPGTNAGR